MKPSSPYKEPLKIGGWLILAALGLLILPAEHGGIVFRLRAASSYGEFTVNFQDQAFIIGKNSSSGTIDLRLQEVEEWWVMLLEDDSIAKGVEPGIAPPLTQVVAVAKSESESSVRLVMAGSGRLVRPGKLLITTEHDDFVRFCLLLLLLSLVGLVALISASYIYGRGEPKVKEKAVGDGGGDKQNVL